MLGLTAAFLVLKINEVIDDSDLPLGLLFIIIDMAVQELMRILLLQSLTYNVNAINIIITCLLTIKTAGISIAYKEIISKERDFWYKSIYLAVFLSN